MPPTKKLSANPSVVANRRVATRSATKLKCDQELPKRKAPTPPKRDEHKRQVLVDITNDKKAQPTAEIRKGVAGNLKVENAKLVRHVTKPQDSYHARLTRASSTLSRTIFPAPQLQNVPKVNFPEVKPRSGTSSSSSSSSTSSCKSALSRLTVKDTKNVSGISEDGELFVTVCESMSNEKIKFKSPRVRLQNCNAEAFLQDRKVPEGVKDCDKENEKNFIEVGEYAMDVFDYLKSIEDKYKVDDYLVRQGQIGVTARAQLVDWLVELQEYFELNHESLYLAVKMLDQYLSKKTVPIAVLQVVGMSCILIASKYEERYPPTLDDLLFISDYVCTRNQLIKMEQDVLHTLNFELGMPLSYCFLRRYGRCIQLSLQDLTLARYILELSLSEYSFLSVSESQMACASLLLALKMLKISDWTPTLEYYTGYKEADFKHLLPRLNDMLHKEKCSTRHHRVFVKYSDQSFFKVATKKLLQDVYSDGSST